MTAMLKRLRRVEWRQVEFKVGALFAIPLWIVMVKTVAWLRMIP